MHKNVKQFTFYGILPSVISCYKMPDCDKRNKELKSQILPNLRIQIFIIELLRIKLIAVIESNFTCFKLLIEGDTADIKIRDA